jgi:hypothetical protein
MKRIRGFVALAVAQFPLMASQLQRPWKAGVGLGWQPSGGHG